MRASWSARRKHSEIAIRKGYRPIVAWRIAWHQGPGTHTARSRSTRRSCEARLCPYGRRRTLEEVAFAETTQRLVQGERRADLNSPRRSGSLGSGSVPSRRFEGGI